MNTLPEFGRNSSDPDVTSQVVEIDCICCNVRRLDEEVNRLIALIELAPARTVKCVDVPLPLDDVLETRADVTDLRRDFGFAPAAPLESGIKRFVSWYRGYHPKTDALPLIT